jgi:hypothetical protein
MNEWMSRTSVWNERGPYGCIRGREFSGTLYHLIDSCHYLASKVSTLHVTFVTPQWYIYSETSCTNQCDQTAANDRSRDGRRTRKRSASMHYLGTIPAALDMGWGGGGGASICYVTPIDGWMDVLLDIICLVESRRVVDVFNYLPS